MSTNRNTLPIYYNVDTKQLSDSSGAGISSAYTPVITYKTYPVLLLNFVDSSGNPHAFPEGMTFKAAIDTDYNIATELVCKSQDTDINQGDWASESLAQGRISVRVSANTTPFGNKIGTAASLTAMLEVTGWVTIDIGGTPMPVRTFIATMPVILSNLVDAEDGISPEELPGDYYTIAQVEARLKEGYELSFSEDSSSWHVTQTSADLYWRYRFPNGIWSGAIDIIIGPAGPEGPIGPEGTGLNIDYAVADIAARDALTGMVVTEVVYVDSTSFFYVYDGASWGSGFSIGTGGGGLVWSYVTEATTAENTQGYLMAGTFTLTLPETPAVGTQVGWRILSGEITLARNGQKIEGEEQDLVLDIAGAGGVWVFQGAEYGWVNVTEISSSGGVGSAPAELLFVCSGEAEELTVGTDKITFRMPYAMTLTGVKASVNSAPTGSELIIDIEADGTSVFSTLLSIDATEETSVTAAVPAVLSTTSLADDVKITVDITQVGSTLPGTGLKLVFLGVRA